MQLIVLDGIDGVGKSTQIQYLVEKLQSLGYKAKIAKFPNYDYATGKLIRAYLQGIITTTNVYQSSVIYATDRALAFHNNYSELLDADFILCDRYLTANLIHQMPLLPKEEWLDFMNWLQDLEYNRLGVPRPTMSILLTAKVELVQQQLRDRSGLECLDIIERDTERTLRSLDAIEFLREHEFDVLDCTDTDSNHIKPITEIGSMIWNLLVAKLPSSVWYKAQGCEKHCIAHYVAEKFLEQQETVHVDIICPHG